MATTERKEIGVTKTNEVILQHLPCEIQYDGSTNMNDYFIETENSEGVKETTFRGRLLVGKEITISDSAQGILIGKSLESSSTPYSVNGVFDKITVWNADLPLTHKSSIERGLEYFSIANAVYDSLSKYYIK